MRIIKSQPIKKEDNSCTAFLMGYLGNKYPVIHLEAISEAEGRRPDYYVKEPQLLIEIKEIHDRAENARSAQWGKIVSKLQKAVDNNSKIDNVKGLYLVNTPPVFKTPTENSHFISASDEIISAVLTGQQSIKVFNYEFEIKKVSNEGSAVVFGSTGQGGWFDAAQTIHENIHEKLKTANIQLGYNPPGETVKRRILLLVNKYLLMWRIDEVFKALSYAYTELISYKNIDEIWLQIESRDGKFVNELLLTKEFLEHYYSNKLVDNSTNATLFQKWFSSLEKISEEHKIKLFLALKTFLKTKKPYQVFDDESVRVEMTRLGEWLIEQEKFNDAIWFLDKFIDDPDPEEPEEYKGDPKFNYHQEIADGGESNVVATVRGHLAWMLQKLAARENYIIKAFQYTKQLLQYKNLYIKLQALIPLVEITARRQWVEEQSPKTYAEFRKVAFYLLRNYSVYPAIAKWLTHVFYYFKDLNTREALEVVDKLKESDESAPLLIYFAIFRERHYRNPDGSDKKGFKSESLKQRLKEMITNNNEKYANLQGGIAWNFWKLLQEQPEEFDTVKSYIDLFLKQPYRKNYYDDMERIIEDWIERKPEICIGWFEILLKNLTTYLGDSKEKARETWISPEKIIVYVAEYSSEKLLPFVKILVDLWKKGSFIGSPREIFESYKKINDPELKGQVKKQFRIWYKEMKYMNPKIEVISWD